MEKSARPDAAMTADLVTLAQAGDASAREELFRRYLPRVKCAAGIKMGWSAPILADIEDVSQDALLKALRSLNQFKSGDFGKWIRSVVDSVIKDAVDYDRAGKRTKSKEVRIHGGGKDGLAEFILAGDYPTPSAVFRGKELEARIARALLDLPDAQREIIVLRQLHDLSYKEIAEQLGFDREGTVRVALSRALSKLAELVSD